MDEYSSLPNHLAKKTREIDVWFREDYFEIIDDPPTKNPDKFVKAKLIAPVEPEVHEFEIDYTHRLIDCTYPIDSTMSFANYKKLEGKRWKITATEVVE